MSVATFTDDARSKAADLVRWGTRYPGDTRGAMQRLAQSAGIPYARLWALRYRPPEEVRADLYARIVAAHAAELDRQVRKLDDERRATTPTTAFGRALVGAAARLAGEDPAPLRAESTRGGTVP